MAITAWTPGTLYLPGSLVSPTIVGPITDTSIVNAGFEAGDSGWTKGAGWAINAVSPYAGSNSGEFSGPGTATLINTTKRAAAPGDSITASCYVQHGASAAGEAKAAVQLTWYNAALAVISTSVGNYVDDGAAGVWKLSTLTATAPSLAAWVAVGATGTNNWTPCYVDGFQWNLKGGGGGTGFAYKMVATDAGLSGLDEPIWPVILGGTVVDNVLTWEAVTTGTVTWEASSVLTSGGSEPTWPAETGAFVSDGNISWETVPLRITDENCPQTKVVAIAASKVFAGNGDIVNFCATLNARDWTTADDAGFLPTGLQQKSQVGVEAMGVYRSNLAVWNASTFQVWQVDPDPAAMALVDAMEGIGSVHQQAVQPVSDDLFFLSALGVRTVSIAEGANNLASGDAGLAIDVLVQAEVVPTVEPIATYYPSGGQYWLAFRTLTIPVIAIGAYLLTTTIYPVEAIDGMQLGAATVSGEMRAVESNEIDMSYAALAGSELRLGLIDGPTPEDAVDMSYLMFGGVLAGSLETYGPFEDAIDASYSVASGSYIRAALVSALTEDHAMEMGISLVDAECSMTAV
jgi:hypothetical protein